MKRRMRPLGFFIGAILTLSPVWGLVAAVIDMIFVMKDFDIINNHGNQHAYSHELGRALLWFYYSFAILPLGVMLLVVSNVSRKKNQESRLHTHD